MSKPTETIPLEVIPEWATVRTTLATVRDLGRRYLYGQVWLGWQLATLKISHDSVGSGRRKESGQSGHFKSWAETVEAETGLPRRTADRLISLFDATKAKLKRVKSPIIARGTLIVFERENPLLVPDDERNDLMDIIASLCDGETQASLMQELGVIPKPKPMPKGGGVPKPHDPEETAGQLAFMFFSEIASGMVNTRTNPDYKKLLLALPLYSDSEHPLSLATLRAETEALLADIKEAEKAATTPAQGRVIKA